MAIFWLGGEERILTDDEIVMEPDKEIFFLPGTLLEKGAARAKEIIANHTPYFKSHQEYFDFMDSLNCEGDRVTYNGDGTVTADIR